MNWFDNKIIFILAVVVIVGLFIYNLIVGNKGTYMDHSRLLWTEAMNELGRPFGIKGSPFGTRPSDATLDSENKSTKSRESSGETECRRAAEYLTGKAFPKKRPDFLRNGVTGANLEIDCFCEELKIGIEYNGAQHYRYTPYFHSSKEAFYNTKYRDEMKARLCAENGVKLVVVPYTVEVKDIEDYLRDRLFN